MGTDIKRVAVIGTGVIGASWTALFLAKGLEVTATDVAPGAEGRLRQFVADTLATVSAEITPISTTALSKCESAEVLVRCIFPGLAPQ